MMDKSLILSLPEAADDDKEDESEQDLIDVAIRWLGGNFIFSQTPMLVCYF